MSSYISFSVFFVLLLKEQAKMLIYFCINYYLLCLCLSRLLETDSKSLKSVNGSRRNSGSSLVSSSSASSNLSHLEEDSWILWGRIVNEWEDVWKKKEKQLKVSRYIIHQATVCKSDLCHLLYELNIWNSSYLYFI